jgi:putative transcriptional regulator
MRAPMRPPLPYPSSLAILRERTQNMPHPTDTTFDLSGKLLIAMPGMEDGRFAKSVVFLCSHSADGTMGLIINKPTSDVRLGQLLDQLNIAHIGHAGQRQVYFGGPVEPGRGFVLHSTDFTSEFEGLNPSAGFGLTATQDVLQALAQGHGPAQAIVSLGYSGWGPGQLESEIADNSWLSCDASPALVFETPDAAKWEAALNSMGVGALSLSAAAGRA